MTDALPDARVRELYGHAVRWEADNPSTESVRKSNLAEFDLWQAEHDKRVKIELLYAVAEAVAGGDSSTDLDRARRAYGDSLSLPSIMEILDDFIEEVENT